MIQQSKSTILEVMGPSCGHFTLFGTLPGFSRGTLPFFSWLSKGLRKYHTKILSPSDPMGQSLWVVYFSTVPSKPPREDMDNGLEINQCISAFCPPSPLHSIHLRPCPVLAFHLLSLWLLTSYEKGFIMFSSLLWPALPKHPSALHFPQLASKTVAV